MGASSAIKREVGPWTLQEGVNLFEKVCIAIGAENICRKSVKLEINPSEKHSDEEKPYKLSEGKLVVLQPQKTSIKQILPKLIKPNRAHELIIEGEKQISWKAI